MSGNTTITNNGNLFVYGGTLTLDNSVNNISRLGVNSAIAVGGGTFAVIGNTAGTTFNVPGIYTGGSYNTPRCGYLQCDTANQCKAALQF